MDGFQSLKNDFCMVPRSTKEDIVQRYEAAADSQPIRTGGGGANQQGRKNGVFKVKNVRFYWRTKTVNPV